MTTDPLKNTVLSKTSLSNMSSLKFAKLHSPKMKSVYWRHFGFPTNENDCIITKQNVVCIICHKVLTNHGNTTNLRAHLQYRHKDLFRKICAEHGIKIPPRKVAPAKPPGVAVASSIKHEPPEQKVKLEYDSSQDASSANSTGIPAEEQAMLYESMVPMTYEDDEIIDTDQFAKIEVGESNVNEMKDGSEVIVCDQVDSRTTDRNYHMNSAIIGGEIDSYQLQDAIVNLIVQDMRNVESLYDPGIAYFVRTLCGNISIPPEKKVESLIRELHSDKFTTFADQIKVHSQVKPYSLGFEIWTNVEHKHFLSIYYNYTTDAPDCNLLNQLYCTLEYNKFTSIDTVFEEFNLQNCTAALVSYDYDDYLKHFLRTKNIPIILSYDVIVNKCLKSVFALPAVASIIEEIKDVVMRYSMEIHSKEGEIPIICEEFPWTYYELLKFFSETVSWPEDVEVLVSSCKAVVDTLSTLSVTLDTLKGEEIPHSSMLSPITAKVLNKKLVLTDNDDEFVATIKSSIAADLEKLVLADDHLTISALLDPRFHRLTSVKNMSNCLQILTEKYSKICAIDGYTTPTNSSDAHVKTSTKKSNLELFFDIHESSSEMQSHEQSSVETDLKRYRNEVYATLDESPFLWWNKMGHLYGSLKPLASMYQCVPCVVNMNFKKLIKHQIVEYRKRSMLSGSLVDAILFLHHNNSL